MKNFYNITKFRKKNGAPIDNIIVTKLRNLWAPPSYGSIASPRGNTKLMTLLSPLFNRLDIRLSLNLILRKKTGSDQNLKIKSLLNHPRSYYNFYYTITLG